MGQKSKNAGKKKSKPSSDRLSTAEEFKIINSKIPEESRHRFKVALIPMSVGGGMKTRKSDITALV